MESCWSFPASMPPSWPANSFIRESPGHETGFCYGALKMSWLRQFPVVFSVLPVYGRHSGKVPV